MRPTNSIIRILLIPVLFVVVTVACGDDATTGVGTTGTADTSDPAVTTTDVSPTSGPPTGPPTSIDPDDPATALAAARARWDALGISDYDLTYREVCFCPPNTVVVHVRGDEITVDPPTTEGYPVEPDDALTVDRMFDRLDEAYTGDPDADPDLGLGPAFRVDVTFDEDWSFPGDVWIDQAEMIADEEYGWEVVSFVPVADPTEGESATPTTG